MLVATIVPQNYLWMTKHDDYFMCLGHLIGKDGMEKYTNFFKKRCAEGKYVIMDNGIIEGDPRPISELIQKAHQLGASEIILPDVLCDSKKTLELLHNSLENLPELDGLNIMIVPQGSTVDEWVACATEMVALCSHPEYRNIQFTIGVPKVLTKMAGAHARILALADLFAHCPIAKHWKYHLLGCAKSPLELIVINSALRGGTIWADIRGVDSALPFVFARAGKAIDAADRPDSDPIDFKRSKVNTWLLWRNIRKWKNAGKSLKGQPTKACWR